MFDLEGLLLYNFLSLFHLLKIVLGVMLGDHIKPPTLRGAQTCMMS
jgi:hypothetical protein